MELTSLELNNTIVRFRGIANQAKHRVARKLIRKVKFLKKKTESSKLDSLKKSYEKKLERYLEDIQALKKLRPDDISKFALLNTKTLQELKISGKTSAEDRVLYKSATNEILITAVEQFREKYPEWHREVPFMLQRLGLQYKFRKSGEKNASDIRKLLKNVDDETKTDDDEETKDELSIEKPTTGGVSLLEKVKTRRKAEKLATKKRVETRKLEALKRKRSASKKETDDDGQEDEEKSSTTNGKKKMKKKKQSPAIDRSKIAKKPRRSASSTKKKSSDNISPSITKLESKAAISEGRRGQIEIRRLRMDGEDESIDRSARSGSIERSSGGGSRKDESTSVNPSSNSISDPFFMGGGDGPMPMIKVKPQSMMMEDEDDRGKMFDRGTRNQWPRSAKKAGPQDWKRATSGGIETFEKRRPKMEDTTKRDQPQSDKKASTQETLHPSWEAKRKEKLLLKSISTIPAGKKIKFD